MYINHNNLKDPLEVYSVLKGRSTILKLNIL